MGDFGKLNFSVSFKRTSAFPICANDYFESLAQAQAAAKTAVAVGSSESTYYIGQTVTVVEGNSSKSYIIQPDKTLKAIGSDENVTLVNDEDISLDSTGQLQFADRPYSKQDFSGKGYKILRKKITINSGQNNLLQTEINLSNTIYEIRYDFNLNGATLNLLEGCILNFVGGSLTNGTLKGNNTLVTGNYKNKLSITHTGLFDERGNDISAKDVGTYAEKPTVARGLCIGFSYFCTDLKTFGGETGRMIYHRGNDIWIDANGAVINETYYQSKWMKVDGNGNVFDNGDNPIVPEFPSQDVWQTIQ